MTLNQIVDDYVAGRIPDGIIYSYTFDLCKLKILAVYQKNHSAFVLDVKTGLTSMLYQHENWYALTPQDAVQIRKASIDKQMKRLQAERERIEKLYG